MGILEMDIPVLVCTARLPYGPAALRSVDRASQAPMLQLTYNVDIDECGARPCSSLVNCTNTPGSYSCGECPSGYTGDGRTCTEANMCDADPYPCSPLVSCYPILGGFVCNDCPAGYSGDGRTCTGKGTYTYNTTNKHGATAPCSGASHSW